MKSLSARSALVTGASQGLGRAIAEEFLGQGASVVLCDREAPSLERTRAALEPLAGAGQRVLARRCDVTQREQVEALCDWAVAELPELDILVNNAGIQGPKGRTEEVAWEEWVETIEVNLLGPVLVCRSLIPHLKRRGYGKIIQLSGGGATAPMPRYSAYSASKAGVVRFAETLSRELLEHHIDVNAIAPGALNTRMLDESLAAGPEAVGDEQYQKLLAQQASGGASLARAAALCAFLASRASDGITGRLISAVWDPWEELGERFSELGGSDIYTLRRILPTDRGKNWQ
jgi:NAD(P)-dependent dehydrogenase (short-subunit alcohol dehydrogenase family)